MKRQPRHPRKYSMLVGLVLFVFIILLVTTVVAGWLIVGLFQLGVLQPDGGGGVFIMALLLASVLIGTALTAFMGKRPLRPFRELAEATREIAAGNFDVRVPVRGPVEMQRLADDFNRMAQELGSIEVLRSDFVSNVSHEFKTPIVSIRGFAKLLRKGSLDEESRAEYLDIIIKESDRLSQLAENVLMLSRLENQEIVTEIAPFSLDEQLRQTILMLEPIWSKKDLNVQVELEPVVVTASEELLQQVWINLLNNAIKFTRPGDTVFVSVSREKNAIAVRVGDTGVGMDTETQRHLFEKFYQGDRSHATEGNGLGLSLVARIVDLCGGRVLVESEPGVGAVFTVELPEAQE